MNVLVINQISPRGVKHTSGCGIARGELVFEGASGHLAADGGEVSDGGGGVRRKESPRGGTWKIGVCF